MRRLRLEHRRMLANGWCTRPQEFGCHFEAICEGCGFFETTVEFLPILRRQRFHAAAHGQGVLEDLYERLVAGVEEAPAVSPGPEGLRRGYPPRPIVESAPPPSRTRPYSASACCAADAPR